MNQEVKILNKVPIPAIQIQSINRIIHCTQGRVTLGMQKWLTGNSLIHCLTKASYVPNFL